MQLNSADGSAGGGPAGPAGGGAGRMRIDHGEYDKAAGHLGRLSESSLTRLSGSLDRASGANSRTRGKDPFTQGIDSVVDGATKGMKKAVERIIKHTGETIPKNLRDTSENHKRNEKSNEDALKKIMGGQDGKGPGGPSKGPAGGRGGAGAGTSLLNKALNDPRHHGVPLGARTCRNDPVDVATGQMVLPQTDLSLPGVLPLVFRRTHLSDYSFGVWFGPSWASTLDERIEVDIRNKAIWARDDGSLLVYDQLPTPAQPEVLPVEGPRIPLRRTSAFGSDVLEFSVTDARSGLTRYFAKTHPQGWRLWLVAIEDRNGNQVDIHRDTAGMPLSVTHNGGYDVQLAGDPDLGRIQTLSLRTPDGPESVAQVMSYGYDSAGNLVAVTNSSGVPLRFEYDGAGRLISWTDRNASTFHYVYDAVGRVTQTIGPEGFLSSTFTYDTANRITRYTDSTGATTVYQLNDHLQVTAETNPLGHTTRFAYDSRDRLLEHTDALGHTTRFERDDRGNLVSLTAADGARATAAFNELDLPVTITERGGLQRRYEYDTKGNPTAVVEADGARTHYTIDDRGHVTAIRDATGATTRIRNNAAGLPIEITAPSGARTTLTRDAFGRITAATDPLGHTVRQGWTVEGKPLWRELADGTREEWAWDGEGNLTSHTDRNGHTRTHTVTHFDRPASTHTTDGGDYRFTHDTELRLTTVTNAQGHQWHYHYDAAGRLTSETDFDGRTLTYEHDALGRLTRRTNAAGQTLTYERDTRGRVVRLQHDDGTASSITYDSTGHAVQITNAHARIELERDPTGRIVAETVNGHTLRRAYDVLGRPTHRRTPSGATSALTYDEQGLASYTAGEHTFRFERDPLGRETVRHLDGTLALHQHWDAVGRLTHQTLTGPHDTLLARAFTYHPDGTPRAIEDSLTGPRTYTTDPAGRITAVTARGWSERYAYNTAGDQTHSTLPNQAPGQDTSGERHYSGARITQAGRTRYTYDAQGRVTERRTTTLSGKTLTWTFAWDAEDRLTDVHAPRGTHWRYLYDALGRRIAKMRLTAEGRCEESTSYCWDGAQLAEQHSNGITLVWDYTGLRPLAQREAKTDPAQQEIDRRFFAIVTDLAGSPSDLIAPDGTVAWRGRSTAWGATQFQRAATAYTPLRYPGQYFDPETGLHYNVNRYYDPDLGRYITSDPLGLAPAVNPYAYVPNPFTFADPLGLAGCESDPTWGGRVVFTRDEHGRPFEMHATVSRDMLDEGTDARKSLRPPGFVHGTDHNQGRGHMLANRLGGSGDTLDNLFTITQNPTNSPHMRDLEASIYDAVKGPNGNDGEIVQYSVYLEYTDDRKDSVPKWITMEADGNRGFSLRADFENPDHAAQQVRRSRGIH